MELARLPHSRCSLEIYLLLGEMHISVGSGKYLLNIKVATCKQLNTISPHFNILYHLCVQYHYEIVAICDLLDMHLCNIFEYYT